MKNVIIILFMLLLASCGTMDKQVYKYEITYEIDSTEYVYMDSLHCPYGMVPVYIQSPHTIRISAAYPSLNSGYYDLYVTIYEGKSPCKVTGFKYNCIRNYKASKFDGHEI